jgi:xanthosine utilization system XapX-like protein
MRAYRRLWWTALVAALAPAVPVALLLSPAPTFVLMVTLLGLLAGAALVEVMHRLRAELVVAVALPLVVLPALGAWAVPVLLVSVLTSPGVVGAVVSRTGPEALPGEVTGVGLHPLPEMTVDIPACLATMSGPELCAAWNASFVRVKTARSARERCLQAGIRGSLLDELERRDHDRFVRWLARRPSAASEPRWVIEAPKRIPPPPRPT